MKSTWALLMIVASMLGLVILGAALYIRSGSYNIAATDQHFEWVRLGLAAIRDRSIEARARETEAPRPELLIAMDGFRPYHGLCSLCHSAPGLEDSPIRQGLNPKPPLLNSEPVQHRSDDELFWIVKHGIKMSGMPAFGPTHNDQDLWHIVAFIRQLPQITRDEYLALVKAAGTVDSDHHGHEHRHPPSHSHE